MIAPPFWGVFVDLPAYPVVAVPGELLELDMLDVDDELFMLGQA